MREAVAHVMGLGAALDEGCSKRWSSPSENVAERTPPPDKAKACRHAELATRLTRAGADVVRCTTTHAGVTNVPSSAPTTYTTAAASATNLGHATTVVAMADRSVRPGGGPPSSPRSMTT